MANPSNLAPINHRTVVKMQGNWMILIICQKKLANFFFAVAVMACFVTFRTPLHIEKAIFVITTVTQKWDENMLYYHRILKLIAGKHNFSMISDHF